MIKLKQAVVVEGNYDRIKLLSVIDAPIISTDGFRIFKDKQKMNYIRAVAEKRGIIILTDSDSAGFLIRSHIGSSVKPEYITHAYIPDIFGKEKRKRAPSREGKLGVEGVDSKVIIQSLARAGIVADERTDAKGGCREITKADLYNAGLSGGSGSKERRLELLCHLNLPERMSANALLQALNIFMTYEEFYETVNTLFGDENE